MSYSDGEWNTISDSQAENVLSYCYDSDGNVKYLDNEICNRLSTTGECSGVSFGSITGILTTNGMRWNFGSSQSLGANESWNKTIYVSLDNYATGDNKNDFNNNCVGTSTIADDGKYGIIITSTGKVTPATDTEKNLLLSNPTKD